MSIHFVAASVGPTTTSERFRRASMPMSAANDNHEGIGGEVLLRAALRHFAEHGLSAASRARKNAESAFFDGRSDDYRWWMAICAALDRRMPSAVAFRSQPAGAL
jgi:hypothetical protein